MTLDASGPNFRQILRNEAARVRGLADDLDAMASGTMPTSEVLAAAPVIDGYEVGTYEEPCLYGRVTGHPYLRGPTSVTSRLIVIDSTGGWARTLTRFYRLGAESRKRIFDAD